jgi:hypothetical protein
LQSLLVAVEGGKSEPSVREVLPAERKGFRQDGSAIRRVGVKLIYAFYLFIGYSHFNNKCLRAYKRFLISPLQWKKAVFSTHNA